MKYEAKVSHLLRSNVPIDFLFEMTIEKLGGKPLS
jgi:hypothetical protein